MNSHRRPAEDLLRRAELREVALRRDDAALRELRRGGRAGAGVGVGAEPRPRAEAVQDLG